MWFSGDETFRPQLATNIGLGAEYKFEDLTYSANSAFLFVRACEMLSRFATEYGLETDDIEWLDQQAAAVRQATEDEYWMNDRGRYSPFIYMDSMEPDPHCGEDINTQPLWLSYLSYDDEQARQNIESCMDDILTEYGILQNANGDDLELFGYKYGEGINTGMTPAYFLYNVGDLNLEIAETTFDALGLFVSRSGNYPEVGTFAEPERALSPFYYKDKAGETWARHRSWEGAISGEALMHYLIGYEADVIEGFIRLAPHLPHDMPYVEAERMPFMEHALSMRYEKDGGGFKLTIACEDDPAAFGLSEYRLRLAVKLDAVSGVSVDGGAVEDFEVRKAYEGMQEVRLILPARQGGTVVTVQ